MFLTEHFKNKNKKLIIMSHYRLLDKNPSAIITVAGSEKKIYQNNEIFLNDGENFEFRFFNPLQVKIGIEIIFDGVKKNNGYLVLKPGQDIVLDRFIDEQRKMKYETYTIDSNNSDAVQAAAMNGVIEIKFYTEEVYRPKPVMRGRKLSKSKSCGSNFNSRMYSSPGVYTNELDQSTSADVNYSDYSTLSCCSGMGSIDYSPEETGRIEKGEDSDQEMKTVNVEFGNRPIHSIVYRLKPTSQLNEGVSEIRQYCSSCGYRLRKQTWQYCPKCGEKLD